MDSVRGSVMAFQVYLTRQERAYEVIDHNFPDPGQVSNNECSGAPTHRNCSKHVRKFYDDHGGSWYVNSHISLGHGM
jgi:hypothetical protein